MVRPHFLQLLKLFCLVINPSPFKSRIVSSNSSTIFFLKKILGAKTFSQHVKVLISVSFKCFFIIISSFAFRLSGCHGQGIHAVIRFWVDPDITLATHAKRICYIAARGWWLHQYLALTELATF